VSEQQTHGYGVKTTTGCESPCQTIGVTAGPRRRQG
jgi:hypothetical protein